MFQIFKKMILGKILLVTLGLGLRANAQAQMEMEEIYSSGGSFKIIINNFRNGSGGVGISVYDSSRAGSFPTDPKNALINNYMDLLGKQQAVFTIQNLKPGYYAVAVYHDENGNKNLDTNFIGLPVEGVAVSRNAKGNFGPPNFDAAKVFFDSANPMTQINIEY